MKDDYTSYRFSEDFHQITSSKKAGYEIIETVLLFLCFYPALSLITFYIKQDRNDIFAGMLLIIPIIIMLYISRKIKRLVLLIFIYLVVEALVAAILGMNAPAIFYIIFLSGYGVYFINKRIKNKNSYWRFSNLSVMNLFSAVIYGFTLSSRFEMLRKFMFAFAVLHLMISIAYFHFSSTNKLLKWEKYNDEKHEKNMRSVNVMFSVIMIIILCGIIFIAAKTSVFSWLDEVNRKIISSLLDLGRFDNKDINVPREVINRTPNPMLKPLEMGDADYSPSAFLLAAEFVVKIIFYGAAAASAVAIIIFLFQKLYLLFISTLNINEDVESVISSKEIADSLKSSISKPVMRLRKALFRSNKDKLRRLYFGAVESCKRKGTNVEQSNTPYEISENIKTSNNIELSGVTELYEKFRYSQEEPTDIEIAEMKKRISGIVKRGR